ncbi:hypothetical protein ACFLY8_03425 [Halobacteriota archaeon]
MKEENNNITVEKIILKRRDRLKNRLSSALKSYPWDYMILIFIAWAIPAFYGYRMG